MRHAMILLVSGMLATSLLAGCNDNTPTGPSSGGTPPPSGGGSTPPPSGGSPAPATASVTLGDIFFKSDHNGTSNPAVDTVAVNGAVTWAWGSSATMPHSVQSLGSPSFTSSAIMTGPGHTHQVTFTKAGTYQYDCAVHGQLMTGRIVVMGAASSSSPSAPMPSTPTGY
jgi:plastocyanin